MSFRTAVLVGATLLAASVPAQAVQVMCPDAKGDCWGGHAVPAACGPSGCVCEGGARVCPAERGSIELIEPVDKVDRHVASVQSNSYSITFMHDGAPAWDNAPESALVNPPNSLIGVFTFVPSLKLTAGDVVRYTCPSSSAQGCDAWVWMYSCPWTAACTGVTDRELPGHLRGEGFDYTVCAPHFVNGVSAYKHRMVGFRKQLAAGEKYRLTLDEEFEFLAFGIDAGGVDCSLLVGEHACEFPAHGMCRWDADSNVCLPKDCRVYAQGPPPPCGECARDGLM